MRIKNKQLKFFCTEEEFLKINSNAEQFNLATGTYLRLLGLLGGVPYETKRGSSIATSATAERVSKWNEQRKAI